MQIVSLNLSGFKHFDSNTQLDLSKSDNPLLTDTSQQTIEFLFDSILGILYGLGDDEKLRFRHPESKIFTGMLTMQFASRNMLIERDYETGFVACLLATPQKAKPLFQGKDDPNNHQNRHYMHMFHSIFPVANKSILKMICYEILKPAPKTLNQLLEIFYLLMSPLIKVSEVRHLLQIEKFNLQGSENQLINDPGQGQRNYLKWKKNILHKMQKAFSLMLIIEEDIKQLHDLVETIRSDPQQSHTAVESLKNEFPRIYKQNGIQLREDILQWKNLNEEKRQLEAKLEKILNRQEQIQRVVQSDFQPYRDIPPTFQKDIENYRNLKKLLASKNQLIQDNRKELNHKEAELKQRRGKRWLLLLLLPVLTFFLSYYFLGPFWLFIIPETLIVTFAVLLYFGHLNENIRAEIFHLGEETRIKEFQARDIENEIKAIVQSHPLVKDEAHWDLHIERFKKYMDYYHEYKNLKKLQAKLMETLKSDPYTRQLAQLEEKYASLIQLNRSDLENYLDRFVNEQNRFNALKAGKIVHPAAQELEQVKEKYSAGYMELCSIRKKVLSYFKISPDGIDPLLEEITTTLEKMESDSDTRLSS